MLPAVPGTSAATPADEYVFRVFGSPVGAYFKDGVKPLTLTVSDFDRAAPHGTGDIKAGLNYAMSLYPGQLAHAAGFAENLYLDPATRTRVEETGGGSFRARPRDRRPGWSRAHRAPADPFLSVSDPVLSLGQIPGLPCLSSCIDCISQVRFADTWAFVRSMSCYIIVAQRQFYVN